MNFQRAFKFFKEISYFVGKVMQPIEKIYPYRIENGLIQWEYNDRYNLNEISLKKIQTKNRIFFFMKLFFIHIALLNNILYIYFLYLNS